MLGTVALLRLITDRGEPLRASRQPSPFPGPIDPDWEAGSAATPRPISLLLQAASLLKPLKAFSSAVHLRCSATGWCSSFALFQLLRGGLSHFSR